MIFQDTQGQRWCPAWYNDKVDRFGYKEKTIITRKVESKELIKQTISRKISEGGAQKRKWSQLREMENDDGPSVCGRQGLVKAASIPMKVAGTNTKQKHKESNTRNK